MAYLNRQARGSLEANRAPAPQLDRRRTMTEPTPKRLDLVYAVWCPHCVPISTDRAPRLAKQWGVPLRLLDIDQPELERIADGLVETHGDWIPDYLIPQVFLEWSDGRIDHLLTGTPGSLEGTTRSWERLLRVNHPNRSNQSPA